MKFYSELLKLGEEIDNVGVFDPLLNKDSNYFINIILLKTTKIPEFKNSYKKINKKFEEILKLLIVSKRENDKPYREALKRFNFPEVNGICLGYSQGERGAGFGRKIEKKVISDAKEIVDLGKDNPEMFHLLGLFEERVGPDRISDMIASIIKQDIINYTKRINKQLKIIPENYKNISFDNGMVNNPYKNSSVLLLPKEILHELPIAKDWEDIDEVCLKISKIRKEINEVIGNSWKKASISEKKKYLREKLIKDNEIYEEIITKYKESKIEKYDFNNDFVGEYILFKEVNKIQNEEFLDGEAKIKKGKDLIIMIIKKFKDLIENNKLSQLLYFKDEPRKEKSAQLLFYGIAESYCEANDLDISPEINSGRGPVDFKFSNGYKKRVLVEIKLTSNPQLIHGIKKQLIEYGKAEKTKESIFLVIDNGKGEERLKKLNKEYKELKKENTEIGDLIVVDAKPKKSASKY